MAISRRKFLKGAMASPLTGLTTDSKQEVDNPGPIYDGKFEYDLALYSLDFAEKFLRGVMDRRYSGPFNTYEDNVNSATRFIHFGVWDQHPSISQVLQVYIPLLKKARDSIDLKDPIETKKHNPKYVKNHASYSQCAMHTQACIQSRIYNLEYYCNGKHSDMESVFERVKKEGKYRFIE